MTRTWERTARRKVGILHLERYNEEKMGCRTMPPNPLRSRASCLLSRLANVWSTPPSSAGRRCGRRAVVVLCVGPTPRRGESYTARPRRSTLHQPWRLLRISSTRASTSSRPSTTVSVWLVVTWHLLAVASPSQARGGRGRVSHSLSLMYDPQTSSGRARRRRMPSSE